MTKLIDQGHEGVMTHFNRFFLGKGKEKSIFMKQSENSVFGCNLTKLSLNLVKSSFQIWLNGKFSKISPKNLPPHEANACNLTFISQLIQNLLISDSISQKILFFFKLFPFLFLSN